MNRLNESLNGILICCNFKNNRNINSYFVQRLIGCTTTTSVTIKHQLAINFLAFSQVILYTLACSFSFSINYMKQAIFLLHHKSSITFLGKFTFRNVFRTAIFCFIRIFSATQNTIHTSFYVQMYEGVILNPQNDSRFGRIERWILLGRSHLFRLANFHKFHCKQLIDEYSRCTNSILFCLERFSGFLFFLF